ncbi:MAG TPA: hypothetical protein H9714_10365 [Candidatus Flavonifractor intestinipullorum]|uniref:Uncharacterized protein n=1 Tax=Candidatus Flavonifractor intestinipullorum TaxID=2838587 RepID=A0A9D2S5Z9_9FIRM|nr:hypothetical protein [Candidatus Flavonifractor intestinipullorum]
MNGLMNRSVSSRAGEFQESKALSEIKGKMFLARQFPRDTDWSLQAALQECQRKELAEAAQYEFPKGDSVVKGPSIRLVEVLARHWGNLTSGVDEIESKNGETVIKAYAWDLETNVSDEKTFSVKHERTTRRGSYKLTDERDIYEMVANKGARRKRACLLAVLPGWYVDAAVAACEETLKASLTEGKSMEEVINSIVSAFQEFSITPAQIEEKLGKEIGSLSKNDVVKLRHLYSAIKDGFVKAGDAFGTASDPAESGLPSEEEAGALDALNERLKGGAADAADPG